MARRRHHQNEIPPTGRWMVSYADFLTLLFAFFVVLYAISSVHNEKFKELSKALSGMFDQPTRSAKPIQLDNIFETLQLVPNTQPNEQPPQPIIDQGDELMAVLWQKLEKPIKEEKVFLRGAEDWVEIAVNGDVFFPSGSAQISDDGEVMLAKLADAFNEFSNPINVEGFTDNLIVAETAPWESNWELSALRAAGIVRTLAFEGVQPQRLAAVGYGEFQPVATNDDDEGRQLNRRVLFVIDRLGNSRIRVGDVTKRYLSAGH
jgi:chemotaxis protein MotB